MGDFDLPGIKVESQALMNFAKGAAEDYQTHGTTITDNFSKLGMKVGLSGLPSAALLATWNNNVMLATSNFLTDVNYGLQAVTTGAVSVAAIYQESDTDAEAQMNAVNSAFYPVSSDQTLSAQRAEQQAQAEQNGEQTEQEIQEEAANTSITESYVPTAPVTSSTNVCRPADPYSAQGAESLVDQHQAEDQNDQENGGHTHYDEYEAPEDTPEGANVPGAPEAEQPDEVILAPGAEPTGSDPTVVA
ncbi:hypothetical protein [Cumulibacter soli]|uniref:hypothetical protein n=1 Tax=Cumulibacter soli TaxID=2546344 RepID=UPI001068B427|nr:hypothetical protein [Cumulibacter soli]